MNEQVSQLESIVRAENNEHLKSKNTPVGVLAAPDKSTSILDLNTSWLSVWVLNFLGKIG